MVAMWPVLFSLALSADQVVSEIAADEVVVFYPTYGHRTTDEKSWVLHVHGRIFEPEEDSLKRAALLGIMRRSFGLSKEEEERATFKERARAFLVDNERNKTIHIRLGESVFRAGKSGPNGHFFADLVLSEKQIEEINESDGGILPFSAVLPVDDRREFAGRIELIEPRGLSVISDIDDTIKVSEVANRRALLANTFLRAYKPVAGMSKLYQKWKEQGAAFHYVSASPWQLYEPISKFLVDEKFPAGSLGMKMFRLHDRSALDLLATQHKYKPEVIDKILTDFPQRRFVLVGDSGEQDPEIYAALALKHPGQVVRILIREVAAMEGSEARYQAAFKDIPRERWQVFADPGEISGMR